MPDMGIGLENDCLCVLHYRLFVVFFLVVTFPLIVSSSFFPTLSPFHIPLSLALFPVEVLKDAGEVPFVLLVYFFSPCA